MKKIYLLLLAALSLTVVSFNFSSQNGGSQLQKLVAAPPNSGGPAVNGNGDRTGSPLSGGNCATCHSGGNFTPNIDVFITDTLGNQKTSYVPGEVYIIEYFILNQIGTPSGFGMQSVLMSSNPGNPEAGTLGAPVTAGMQVSSSGGYNYVEHSTPSSVGIWQVRWTAPSVGFGDVNIYASGIAANLNGGTSGDESTPAFMYTFPEACLPTSSTDTQSSCQPYTWIDGNTYASSNNSATHVVPNAGGCDSTITLDLTIAPLNTSVTQASTVLTADETGLDYQWVNCSDMLAIAGATNQSYTATINGDYAVIVTDNGCSDTSSCVTVSSVSLDEIGFGKDVSIQPNPMTESATLDLGKIYNEIEIQIVNSLGQSISVEHYKTKETISLEITGKPGVYYVIIQSEEGRIIREVIKK
ncbi:MAG: hypothetical protein ACJASQ_003173 [Crocinitomicaceae bacterium]|jgi:hypothetical protein